MQDPAVGRKLLGPRERIVQVIVDKLDHCAGARNAGVAVNDQIAGWVLLQQVDNRLRVPGGKKLAIEVGLLDVVGGNNDYGLVTLVSRGQFLIEFSGIVAINGTGKGNGNGGLFGMVGHKTG